MVVFKDFVKAIFGIARMELGTHQCGVFCTGFKGCDSALDLRQVPIGMESKSGVIPNTGKFLGQTIGASNRLGAAEERHK